MPCFKKIHVTIQSGIYTAFIEFSMDAVLVHKYIAILNLVYGDNLVAVFSNGDGYYARLTIMCPSPERVDSATDLCSSLADEL